MEYLSPFGEPCGQAKLKLYPEDFQVSELPSFKPSGEGEHLWLWIKKTGVNTVWVAEELSKQSGLKLRDVSYAGRKDKQAITEQWFSIYDPKRIADKVNFQIANCNILQSVRHTQKLRIGNLKGNRFLIRLRDFEGDSDSFKNRLKLIGQSGFPNYFGRQRFGREHRNIAKAIQWVETGKRRLRRDQRSLYFSTLRGFLFNLILSERIRDNTWSTLLNGELAQLDGSNSVFIVDQAQSSFLDLQARCAAFDVHPTACLFGQEKLQAESDARECESAILNAYPIIVDFLKNETTAMRRVLRVRPEELSFEQEHNDWLISFKLPAGSYATVLVDMLVKVTNAQVK